MYIIIKHFIWIYVLLIILFTIRDNCERIQIRTCNLVESAIILLAKGRVGIVAQRMMISLLIENYSNQETYNE